MGEEMAKGPEPVLLELASLPREQVGPFLLLGLGKTAERKAVERNWAERVKWARRQQVKVPLEDINWARDILNDVERRVCADAATLNADTTDCLLEQLGRRYGLEGGQAGPVWQPLDNEKALADYNPAAEVPDAQAVRDALTLPRVPEELPALVPLLAAVAMQALDPWNLELPPAEGGGPASPRARAAAGSNA
jgi:hypothetical protein